MKTIHIIIRGIVKYLVNRRHLESLSPYIIRYYVTINRKIINVYIKNNNNKSHTTNVESLAEGKKIREFMR